jgi:hypothetical protein
MRGIFLVYKDFVFAIIRKDSLSREESVFIINRSEFQVIFEVPVLDLFFQWVVFKGGYFY